MVGWGWYYQGTRRTRGSYATTHTRGYLFGEYPFMEKAIQFAEENWGDRLMLDTWEDVIRIHLEDPSDLMRSRGRSYPSSKGVLTICIGRRWNDIINDHSKPESVLIDESVIAMDFDRPFVGRELRGERGWFDEYSCAYCGDGLHLLGCGGCLHLFDDNGFRSGWATPLSTKMVEFLRANGYEFKRDPKIAREAEARRFELAQRLWAIKENARQT